MFESSLGQTCVLSFSFSFTEKGVRKFYNRCNESWGNTSPEIAARRREVISRRLEAYRGADLFRGGDLDAPFLSLFITRRAVGSSTMRSCMYPAASALRSASALDLPETTQMERATFL